jgi:uncharacterized repeat protein (TIGR01451 family)
MKLRLLEKPVSAAYVGLLILSGVIAAPDVLAAAPANGAVTVSVARRDLRPVPGVTLQLVGGVNRQGVTDENGRAAFLDLPAVGAVTITPLRSGFRFEPAQLTIPDLANASASAFLAFPSATDLAVSIASDDAAPLVGASVNSVITLRNLGAEAATDVAMGFSSLPGLALEDAETTQGRLEFQAYQTVLRIPQLDPGAVTEVRTRSRATLPDANVLTVAVVDEMDQTDANPLNNSAEFITHPRPATARLSLAMTIDPATAKAGETIPVHLTLRNDGPSDATQVVLLNYLPPGASFIASAEGLSSSRVIIPRLGAGTQIEFSGAMRVRIPGTFTLIANVTYLEQQLPPGAEWPEARANFTVHPAFARLSLFAFSDPPNPRVGDDVTVLYVARNDGPDAVTGLRLFTREDARLAASLTLVGNHPPPPLPGPFVFGDVLPVGAYTYLTYHYSVKAAGDLTNYFTVEYQDQLIPNAEDHPELTIAITTLPADVALSLDANPKEIIARSGEPVTIEFPVHNDGPQPARGVFVDYDSQGLLIAELDEVIHGDRVVRPGTVGYIDMVEPGETVRLRKHFIASTPGLYTNVAQITGSHERPDLLLPIAAETIQLRVLPGPPPDLAIAVNVDKPQVNIGEYAIFIVTVTNRAVEPAFNVWVSETDAVDVGFAFETVRSYGPGGDDRISSASQRIIPRIEPGASYSMSRTMRLRKPVTIPYVAKITRGNGLLEADLPTWVATSEVTGVQVTSDIAPVAVADRTNVKNGDLVNFVIKERNVSTRVASHAGLFGGVGAGFQMLNNDLSGYGYFFDWSRPKDLQTGATTLSEWIEIGSQQVAYTYFSAYTVSAGQFTMSAQLSQLDQLDGQAANDFTQVQVDSAPASARISLRQSTPAPTTTIGYFVPFVTEIRNEGPDRVTGLTLMETTSANLELSYNPYVNGISGEYTTSFLDSLVRLPPLEPGQTFIWQRSYNTRAVGNGWRRVQVAGFDQTPLAPLPEIETALTVEAAQADLQLQFLEAPTVGQVNIPALVGVRIRNLGPAVATGVKVAVTGDGLSLSSFGYGPRASIDLLGFNTFQTQLLPGESATVGFHVTPLREGMTTATVRVQQSDEIDPQAANNELSLTLNAGPEPATAPILRVRKVRTDFFDGTPIAEVEIDQAELNRVAPFTLFNLEASSNLRDWELLTRVGLLSLAPVTFTDHAPVGVKTRTYRLRRF